MYSFKLGILIEKFDHLRNFDEEYSRLLTIGQRASSEFNFVFVPSMF